MKKSPESKTSLAGMPPFGTPVQKATLRVAGASSASGRWGVVRHARLPHKEGLPLSCGGGDGIER